MRECEGCGGLIPHTRRSNAKFCSHACMKRHHWVLHTERNPHRLAERVKYYSDRAKRRRYWLDRYKVAKGCELCGYRAHPFGLQWDHIDPSTKVSMISAMMTSSLKRLFQEIRRCRVLCCCCHMIHTLTQGNHHKRTSQ